MSVDFRSAVFQLCRIMNTNADAIKIRNTIYGMSVVTTEEDNSELLKRPSHGDLAQIAEHQRLQFLGYLLADEAVDDINKTRPFQATHLDENERYTIEMAYITLQLFISECTKELKEKYPKAVILIDPYGLYKKPKIKKEIKPFLNNDDVRECANAFKSGKIYKKIIENDALRVLEKADENTIRQLCVMQQKQFADDFSATTKETTEYVNRIQFKAEPSMPDLLMTYSIYCYALRQSLVIAAQMLFESIIGNKLLVIDNNKIINLEGKNSDAVYEKYVVLIQDALWGDLGGGVGSIVLLSCTPLESYHIKEFGVIFALTISFAGEFGDSSKITMVTVDEELNEIHLLTDTIISTRTGRIAMDYRGK